MTTGQGHVAAITQGNLDVARVSRADLSLLMSLSSPEIRGVSYSGREAEVRALVPDLLAAGYEQVEVFRWREEATFWMESFLTVWAFDEELRVEHGSPRLVPAKDIVAGDVVWVRGSTRERPAVVRWTTTREGRVYISGVEGRTLDPEEPLTVFRHAATEDEA